MLYRHKECGRLSRINGVCEDCDREARKAFWIASPLSCGHDNSGIPFNKSEMGICDICELELLNTSRRKDEERLRALKLRIKLNKFNKNETNKH